MAPGRFTVSLLIILFPLLISANEIKNKLVGLPIVECIEGAISFKFQTEKSFNGRVYARGLEDDAKCVKRFSDSISDQNGTNFSLSIKRGDCNMDKQRTQDGIAHTIVIIVAFHSVFETKNDMAFRGVCFFRAPQKIAGSLRGVAGSVSVVAENNGKAPALPFSTDCTYSIRGESEDGLVIRYAKDMGILVHSCTVEDGRGGRYDLLDDSGCPLDEQIGLSQLEYENATSNAPPNVYRAVGILWGYKFSRTTELKFRCVVTICDRRQGQCDGLTPPKCDRNQTRIITDEKAEGLKNLDVITDMHVLDNFDDQLGDGGVPTSFFHRLNAISEKRPARCVAARCRGQKV